MRRGWVTMGPEISETTFEVRAWNEGRVGGRLVRSGSAVERIRPKSPPGEASPGAFESHINPPQITISPPLPFHSQIPDPKMNIWDPRQGDPFTSPSTMRRQSVTWSSPSEITNQMPQLFVSSIHSKSHSVANPTMVSEDIEGGNHLRSRSIPTSNRLSDGLSHSRRPSGQLLQRLMEDLQPKSSRQSGRVLHKRLTSWESIAGSVDSMRMQEHAVSAPQLPTLTFDSNSETVNSTKTPDHSSATSIPDDTLSPLRQRQRRTSISTKTPHHQHNRSLSTTSLFHALTAHAFQKAVEIPDQPPPANWFPDQPLHSYYHEMAMRFQDVFMPMVTTYGPQNPHSNTSSIETESLHHIRAIFTSIRSTWSTRPLGSTTNISIAHSEPNAALASLALRKSLEKPMEPPKENWKVGEPLHSYYESLLNRFDVNLRELLAERNHPVLQDQAELTRGIDEHAERIVGELRATWVETTSQQHGVGAGRGTGSIQGTGQGWTGQRGASSREGARSGWSSESGAGSWQGARMASTRFL